MLKLNNINTCYDDVQALFDVSLDVREGDIVSIVGSNGAGKSTLLNTISGILRCSSGTIEFLGKRTESLPPHQIVEQGIIQVPEGRHIFPRMTVLENLELGAYTRKARGRKKENLDIVFELLPALKERKNQLAGTLSGGERQMLAVARGVMSIPKLLMFDEPSLGLAPKLVKQVFEIAKEINKKGITVLLVEQNIFHSLSISNKGYVLENGKIVLEGKGKELLNNKHVRKAYLGI
ncbi:ABC transporter ATP-binding protein [Candidatus Aerophobetes bacterium]|nr:ABC transporter ATP-binding protein [Candidatus Aerophobetes bacterium]